MLVLSNILDFQLDSELKRLKEENAKLRQQVESSQNSSLIREYEHLQQQVSESEAALKKTRTIYQTKVCERGYHLFQSNMLIKN